MLHTLRSAASRLGGVATSTTRPARRTLATSGRVAAVGDGEVKGERENRRPLLDLDLDLRSQPRPRPRPQPSFLPHTARPRPAPPRLWRQRLRRLPHLRARPCFRPGRRLRLPVRRAAPARGRGRARRARRAAALGRRRRVAGRGRGRHGRLGACPGRVRGRHLHPGRVRVERPHAAGVRRPE